MYYPKVQHSSHQRLSLNKIRSLLQQSLSSTKDYPANVYIDLNLEFPCWSTQRCF